MYQHDMEQSKTIFNPEGGVRTELQKAKGVYGGKPEGQREQ